MKRLGCQPLGAMEAGADTRHLRGAMYLAGYGVECILKAYVISRQRGCSRLPEAQEAMRQRARDVRDICGGVAGHNLMYLLSLTGLEASMDTDRQRQMGTCAKWRSSWRYDPDPPTREAATAMATAARALVDWICSQI